MIPAAELAEQFTHASGPGGQGVNTTDSRVQLSFDVGTSVVLTDEQRGRLLRRLRPRLSGTVLTVVAAEFRSQRRNRVAARERLAKAIDESGIDQLTEAADDRGTHASLRRFVCDLIEEYGRHTGHADLLRENVDGLVGEDPPAGWKP